MISVTIKLKNIELIYKVCSKHKNGKDIGI